MHSESPSAVTLLLHADWMMLKTGGANSVTVAPQYFAHEIQAADAGRFESCISRKVFGG